MAATESEQEEVVVLGLGGACVDFLAYLPHFPVIDTKVGTEQLRMAPGGNIINQMCGLGTLRKHQATINAALRAAGWLGVRQRSWRQGVLSKWAADYFGQVLNAACEASDMAYLPPASASDHSTGFTYIIVSPDTPAGSHGQSFRPVQAASAEPRPASDIKRTCIHTPGRGATLTVSDLSRATSILACTNPALVFLDGRQVVAAQHWLSTLQLSPSGGRTVILDCERVRDTPEWWTLLPQAHLVVASEYFILPCCTAVHQPQLSFLPALAHLIKHVFTAAVGLIATLGARGALLVAPVRGATDVEPPVFNALSELFDDVATDGRPRLFRVAALSEWRFLYCPAYRPAAPISDTTGAGDAFIAALGYACLHDWCQCRALVFAAWFAAQKCTVSDVDAIFLAPSLQFPAAVDPCICGDQPLRPR